ncbi:KamA family protein [Natranaerovirga pectinivora]|uniref:KamA family protein n=1 Tax=Natranaerovirga pectinivora TaxID=682400 RepID=A0A4R3MLR6_9FIRM|nr:KamA family radical SAM protein [Natranaerovirga pectinivora]TCT13811.1 KamA family protein [Natranaerovirga pectinivora]
MNWKKALRENATTVEDLKKYFTLTPEEEEKLGHLIDSYPMSTTKYYLSLINTEDPMDPIKKMSIPSVTEFDVAGLEDTSGEQQNTKMQGLQHKYKPTVLLLSTTTCAMYCRHCFRKRLVGLNSSETLRMFDEAVNYIKEHKEVSNVLISGGDSFLLDTDIIEKLLKQLCEIEHLDFIRFGTRTPVVFPQRIFTDDKLLSVLNKYNKEKRIYVVTQFNHPNEITDEAKKAIAELQNQNIVVGNQTVLLKDVNDNPDTLVDLMRSLTQIGVVPYYVFQCRPVKGVASSFQISIKDGIKIVEEAKSKLNGHAKRFRYALSHVRGKIEILGQLNESDVLFKYHQAKDINDTGRIFSKPLTDECWLFDLE